MSLFFLCVCIFLSRACHVLYQSDGDDSDNDSDSDDGSDTESEARSEADPLSEDEDDVEAGSETEFDLDDGDKEAGEDDDEEKGEDEDDEALNDSEEEDTGEGQDASGEGVSSRRMKKRKASTANLPGRDGDGNLLGQGSEDELGEGADDENHAAVSTAAAMRAARRDRRARVASYYEGCHHGLPSALVLFDLCSKLNRADNDQIWLACLGITDSFVNEKVGVYLL
jgi:hypothetical protein